MELVPVVEVRVGVVLEILVGRTVHQLKVEQMENC